MGQGLEQGADMVKQRQLEKLKQRVEPENWTDGIEMPLALMGACHEDPATLASLAFRSIISAQQFTREQIVQLCRLAAKFETSQNAGHFPLTGRILISAFYEPSTRTRLSFESVWQDAIYEMLDGLRIPIVNAGNGIDEHPTQALADMYAIFKWRPDLMVGEVKAGDKITIGIIGVPGRMRTVRSLLTLLSRFSDAFDEVVIVCNEDEIFSQGQREQLEKDGLKLSVSKTLNDVLAKMDVVYINAIAWVGDSYEELGTEYGLSTSSPLKQGAIILHPLARGDELDTGLDGTPHNWYFAQARGAVYMRMALLSTLMRF
jgi:aspartate carbamoyltransferase catalytic subunit